MNAVIAPEPACPAVVYRTGLDDEAWLLSSQRAGVLISACLGTAHFARGIVDAGLLAEAVRIVGRNHEILSSRFEREGETLLCRTGVSELVLERGPAPPWLTADGEGVTPDPFTGPMVSCAFLEYPDRDTFHLQASHAAVDGWGYQLLVDELGETYEALCRGGTVRPEPRPQMRGWVAHQRAVLARDGARLAARWAVIVSGSGLAPPGPPPPDAPLEDGSALWTSVPGLWDRGRGRARTHVHGHTTLRVEVVVADAIGPVDVDERGMAISATRTSTCSGY